MHRLITTQLLKWKDEYKRKPLILQGARQVGKSYLVKTFLAPSFSSYLEINLEKQPQYRSIFEGDLNPKILIPQLELLSQQKITLGETLLFIDEIQVVPRALLALRYFYEELPALHVIAAGSLLQFAIDKVGVPVGRVSFKFVAPLSFQEFLINSGNKVFSELLESHDLETPLSSSIHEKGLEILSQYMAVGGMPEVLSTLLEKNDYLACERVQAEILQAFQNDFPKYAHVDSNLQHVALVFERIPHLAMRHFKFVHISRDLQAKYVRVAIDTLRKACIVNLVYSCGNIHAKASFDPDNYKISFLDIGLMQRAAGLPIAEWIKNKNTLLNQGNLSEQFVAQEITAQDEMNGVNLFFWERQAKGSSAEVDFLVPVRDKIIPIEVKSGTTGSLKSLHMLLQAERDIPYAIKTSANNFSKSGKIKSIPLYAFPTWLRRVTA